MSKNSTAKKAQETEDFVKSHLFVVTPGANSATEKVSNLQEKAEDVQAEPIQQQEPVIIATIEDIKRKAELLTRLSIKYDNLVEKRKRMENFAISHDNDTAEILLHDALGETFKSNSPKAIAQFIEYCKSEFSEVIKETENQMREIA